MAVPAQDKYFLRSLHQEIDLFDRKLAHMLQYDSFASDADRKASANKLAAKRETLARTARKLVEDGIEFKASELPRSFRTDASAATVAGVVPDDVAAAPPAEVGAVPLKPKRPVPSPHTGTIFDVQADVQAYKRSRNKAQRPTA